MPEKTETISLSEALQEADEKLTVDGLLSLLTRVDEKLTVDGLLSLLTRVDEKLTVDGLLSLLTRVDEKLTVDGLLSLLTRVDEKLTVDGLLSLLTRVDEKLTVDGLLSLLTRVDEKLTVDGLLSLLTRVDEKLTVDGLLSLLTRVDEKLTVDGLLSLLTRVDEKLTVDGLLSLLTRVDEKLTVDGLLSLLDLTDQKGLMNAEQLGLLLGFAGGVPIVSALRVRPWWLPEPEICKEIGTADRPYLRVRFKVATVRVWLKTHPERGPGGSERQDPTVEQGPTAEWRLQMLARLDPREPLNGSHLSLAMGYENPNQVTDLLRRGRFVAPDVDELEGTSERPRHKRIWYPQSVLEKLRAGDFAPAAAATAAPAQVSDSGDPEELLGSAQVAVRLKYKDQKSFISALSAGSPRLRPLQGTWVKVKAPHGGPPARKWPRRIVDSVA
ncbi:hypothetical protein [Streptomyces nanshensis]|uniref:Uncharacterized protein n=1 Tax=Streptomyces nanshensis TaxID=518642 RepID=A0A1E7L441_9ACTN|nr:hypothetical protein [Streptomyces nanshensis]OEV10918.1 hypothetical protein AN218_15370 [Streptomyces nanshensis]